MTSSGAVLAEKSSKLSLGNRNNGPNPHADVNLQTQTAHLLQKSSEDLNVDSMHPRQSSTKRRASSHIPGAKKMRSIPELSSATEPEAEAAVAVIDPIENPQGSQEPAIKNPEPSEPINSSSRLNAAVNSDPELPATSTSVSTEVPTTEQHTMPDTDVKVTGKVAEPSKTNNTSIPPEPSSPSSLVPFQGKNAESGSAEPEPKLVESPKAPKLKRMTPSDTSIEAQEEAAAEEAVAEAGDEILEEDEDADAEEDDEDEAGDAERVRAIEALTKIEILFANFRNKLHDQQMARFELEISMCDKGTHPELLAYKSSLKTMNDDRLARSQSLLEYQKQCITNQTRAMRTQVMQTHIYNKFRLQSRLLGKATSMVYKVNSERRAMDKRHYTLPQMAPRFEASPAAIAQSHLLDYVGFPAAPPLSNVTEGEELDDMRQMGLR